MFHFLPLLFYCLWEITFSSLDSETSRYDLGTLLTRSHNSEATKLFKTLYNGPVTLYNLMGNLLRRYAVVKFVFSGKKIRPGRKKDSRGTIFLFSVH